MDRFDIQYGEAGLLIEDNDVVWGISDSQHIQDTINAAQGWWKENFSDGVDIRSFLNSDGQEQVIKRLLKINLESDLYFVANPKVYFNGGKLIIEPNATTT